MELLLLIIAWALKAVLSPVLLIYGIIASLIRREPGKYFYGMALSIDCFGNTMGRHIFNDLLRRPGGYDFGNHKDTISYALGKNAELGTLTQFGRFVGNILDALDPDHLKKAVQNNDNK